MGKILEKYGYKGTFYLHGDGIGAEAEQSLAARGHRMGSHSVSHPYLGLGSYNRIFEEIMKSRIDLEARLDMPINSYAFSFGHFSHYTRPTVHWDIYRLLRRAGYVHVANNTFRLEGMEGLSGSCLLPGDGAPVGETFDKFLKDKLLSKKEPNITFNMHAWAYCTPEQWQRLESQLKRYANNDQYWYCSQTDYGAYRFERNLAKIADVKKREDSFSFNLVRPSGIDSNSLIPLSLKITGANFKHAVIVVDEKVIPRDKKNEKFLLFSVPYPDDDRPPHKIDVLYTQGDYLSSRDFSLLQALLTIEDEGKYLTLRIKNSGRRVTEIIVTYRLPLALMPGVIRKDFSYLENGQTLKDTVALNWVEQSRKYLEGRSMFVAQIDFLFEGERNRIYVVSYKDIEPLDSQSYPKGNFSFLGPISQEEYEGTDLLKQILKFPEQTNDYLLPKGRKVSWKNSLEDKEGYFDPEFIVLGKEGDKDSLFILTSLIYSPKRQGVKVECNDARGIWLNSMLLDAGGPLFLEKGLNRLIVATRGHTAQYVLGTTMRGLFLRLTSPETGKRIRDIQYGGKETKTDKKEILVKNSAPSRVTIKDWLICGPFPNPGDRPHRKGFDKDYLSGRGGEKLIEPLKKMEVGWEGIKYAWMPYHSEDPIIDLLQFPPIKEREGREHILIYACSYITVEKEQDIFIGVGSDDGYKLWLNHKLVKVMRVFRALSPDQEVIKVRLEKGTNLLMLKVDQDIGGFGFSVSLNSPFGEPLTDIRTKIF